MKRGGQQAEAGDALGHCSPGQGKDVSAREITVEVVSFSDHKKGCQCKLLKGRMSVL